MCWDNALAESFFATYKLELIQASVMADPDSHPDGDRPLDRSRLAASVGTQPAST